MVMAAMPRLYGRHVVILWPLPKWCAANFISGVMNIDGSGERLLARGFFVEGPTWAPNGRVLMYFKQDPLNEDGTGGE